MQNDIHFTGRLATAQLVIDDTVVRNQVAEFSDGRLLCHYSLLHELPNTPFARRILCTSSHLAEISY